MPRYDATRPSRGPAAPRPFPGDHLKRTGKGRRPAEEPPVAADDQPAVERGGEPADAAPEKPGQAADE